MSNKLVLRAGLKAVLLCGVCAGALATQPVRAQQQQAGASQNSDGYEEIVVYGVRKSLEEAVNAKRAAANFTDSVYAEDIGKFPDLNLAEAINRVPGMQLTRDIDGEGYNIQIRGLGTNFTKVLLNGAQVAVASDGTTDAGNSNREIDLNMFPTELFTRITVNKTAEAQQLEGGAAGVVDLRAAHAFDKPGLHLNYSYQQDYHDLPGTSSPRGSVLFSDTFGDKFGVLLGFAGNINHTATEGYEDGNAYLITGRATDSSGHQISGQNGGASFNWATTVPTQAGGQYGLVAGQPINQAAISGLSLQQLANAELGRLPREESTVGHRDYNTTLASFEFRPTPDLSFAFDAMAAFADNQYNRLDMDWAVRNSGGASGIVPVGLAVDSNNVVTAGTFLNSQFFLEARPYHEETSFYNFNPTMEYTPLDWIKIDGQLNYNYSLFRRSDDGYLFNSPFVNVNYSDNTTSGFPTITASTPGSSVNPLNNPEAGWTWNALRIQQIRRQTHDEGTHWDVTLGDERTSLKMGAAYDDVFREIYNYNYNPSATFLTGAATNANLGNYLLPGPTGGYMNGISSAGYNSFITPNYSALSKALNVPFLDASAPLATSSQFGSNGASGRIGETTEGGYLEADATREVYGIPVHADVGLRGFQTYQTVSSPSTINGNLLWVQLKHKYNGVLPAANVAVDALDDLVFRAAASRTMTRPNPNSLLPGLSYTDPTGETASEGNPNLTPFYSNNFDVGAEYYTGGPGIIGVTYFHKAISGFTANSVTTEPFSALGIPFSSVTALQQQGLNLNGGVNAPITVTQQVNLGQHLHVDGIELLYNQPLDFLVKGAGLTANYTHVSASPTGFLYGVAPNTYNLGGYYENYGLSVHLTYVFTDKTDDGPEGGVSVNGQQMHYFSDARGQLDMSASYENPWVKDMLFTFNAINLNGAPLRMIDGYENAPHSWYYSGRQFLFGVRGSF
jgi:TonB-dependent receptor